MFRNFLVYLSFLFFSIYSIQIVQADDKPTLTVYSYDSFMSKRGPGPKIKTNFEAICDCKLNVITIGDGVMILNRLKLEGSRSKADVLLGLDTNLIAVAKQSDLVQPHKISKPDDLAIEWWDNDFIPYDYGHFAFIYNQEKIKKPPKNFAELLNSKNNWKIVYQDPRTSTPGLGLLLWVNKVYGANTEQAWQQLAKQTLTVTKGWSESYGLFLKGEADFVLSYDTSPAVHIINDNDHRYRAAMFSDGHYQQIEVAAISKQTKQFELAQQFVEFLLTPYVQKVLSQSNIMFPVTDVDLPEAYKQLDKVTNHLSFTPEEVMKNQKLWINQWRDTVSK